MSWGQVTAKLIDTLGQPFGLKHTDGALDVYIQDQTTPAIMVKFNKVTNSTTLASVTAIDDMTIEVTSATGISVGSYIILFNSVEGRFFIAEAVAINGTTISVDRPLDFAFPVGSDIDIGVTDMSVDGSVTTQAFGIRASTAGDPLNKSADIVRLIFKCTTATAVDLSKFGDITKLIKGIVLRKRDGTYQNIFNIKDNGEIAGLMYDWTPFSATNPQQGVDGFVSRLTFGGQNKIGVTIRIAPDEDLEVLIQDDLSGLTLLEITAEGHIVD